MTAPRQEASRRAAQHALLAALRRVYPAPLVELRDGLIAAPAAVQTIEVKRPPARSTARQAAIRRAQRRVQIFGATVDDPPVVVGDFDGWADRWHLHALLDLAPYLRAYWQKRPAAGARFAPVPRVVPISPQRRITVVIDADRDTKAAFLARAEAFYEQQVNALSAVPAHRRRQLHQHAEWYVREHVQGWRRDEIAAATYGKDGGNTDTIRKGIAAFLQLLVVPPSKRG